jgi:hypothetical protein
MRERRRSQRRTKTNRRLNVLIAAKQTTKSIAVIFLSFQKCSSCEKVGHTSDDCRSKKKVFSSSPRKDKDKMVADALSTKEANIAEEGMDMDEETLMAIDAASSSYLDQDRENNANYDYDVYLASRASNSETRMYDWLADSGSTNHIAC